MANNIVQEIIDASKTLIESELPDYTNVYYEYALEANGDDIPEKGYGFIPLAGSFKDTNAVIRSTTIEHQFQIILTRTYVNVDDDTAQRTAIGDLYNQQQSLIVAFNKKKLTLATPTNKVLLINGVTIEEPEFLNDNEGVAVLRCNINIQYRYSI